MLSSMLSTPLRVCLPAYAQRLHPAGDTPLRSHGEFVPQEWYAFDLSIVDPDRSTDMSGAGSSERFAYVSLGELDRERPYARLVPHDWLVAENSARGTHLIDQAQPGWPQFFVECVISPLWDQGFRGFFLDGVDAYLRIASRPRARARQERGLVEAIRRIKATYPGAKLLLHRGFEILPEVHSFVMAIVAESLFEHWDPVMGQFLPVDEGERDRMLMHLHDVKHRYGLPVIAIEFVPLEDRGKTRDVAERIARLGFIPWVGAPAVDTASSSWWKAAS